MARAELPQKALEKGPSSPLHIWGLQALLGLWLHPSSLCLYVVSCPGCVCVSFSSYRDICHRSRVDRTPA